MLLGVGFLVQEIEVIGLEGRFMIDRDHIQDHHVAGAGIAQQADIWPQPPDRMVLHVGALNGVGGVFALTGRCDMG